MIQLLTLTLEEYEKVISVLNFNKLREPVRSNDKLRNKYSRGFRPQNMTSDKLANMYFKEINSGNATLRQLLTELIEQYFVHVLLNESIDIMKRNSVENAFELANNIAKSKNRIPFEILCKLYDIKLPENVSQTLNATTVGTLSDLYNGFEVKMDELSKQAVSVEELLIREQNRNKELSIKIEKLSDETKNKDKELKEYFDENKVLEDEVKSLKNYNEECIRENSKLLLDIKSREATINRQEEEKKQLLSKIENLRKQAEKELCELKELLEQSEIKFDRTVLRVIESTALEIKSDFDLSFEEINGILDDLEKPCTIKNVWQQLSERCIANLENIEHAIQNEHIEYALIDVCDTVENYVYVEFKIIKAIKAMFFDALSEHEKEEKINSSFV